MTATESVYEKLQNATNTFILPGNPVDAEIKFDEIKSLIHEARDEAQYDSQQYSQQWQHGYTTDIPEGFSELVRLAKTQKHACAVIAGWITPKSCGDDELQAIVDDAAEIRKKLIR